LIPTRDELLELSLRREGNLREAPFGVLLQALAVHGRTLVLEVARNQLVKKIVLEGGVPVDCRSNLVQDTLGGFLVAAGRLSEEECHACLARAAAGGVQMGEVLVARGLLTPVELWKALQQNLAKKLLDLFTWREGAFRLAADDVAPASALKIRVPQLVVTGITRFAPQEEVNAAVGPLVGRPLALHPAPPFPLAELRLAPGQERLIGALARGARMDELAAATGLAFDDMTRLVYALGVVGIMVPADQLPRAASTAPAANAGATAAVAASGEAAAAAASHGAASAPVVSSRGATEAPRPAEALSAAEVDAIENELMQAYLAHRRQDAFDLLGVPEEAALPEIDRRFLDFAARYAPARFAGPALARLTALTEKAAELFLAGAKSYGQLADREQRETLLFRRRTLREERSRRPTGPIAIKTDLLDPEAQYRKGMAALAAGRLREAIQLFEFASDCDPQNGLYRAELARSRFQQNGTARAVAELEEALRIDPRCGLALLYLGEIQGELGDLDAAEANLQRAIKMMAPDRRPIEALKSLQAKRKKRR
jgi:tetratricopeptide (TPR) repeat protein